MNLEQLSTNQLREVIRNNPSIAADAWLEIADRNARVRHFREVLLPQFKAEPQLGESTNTD